MPSEAHVTDKVAELIQEIRGHVDWYDKRAWWMQRYYVVLVTIGSLSGFIATLLLNLDWLDTKSGLAHYIVTSLPALASLATFIAATFGIRDLWMLRETGIYDAKRLKLEAEALGISTADPTKFETARLEIKERLRQLERRQAIRVIGALGGSALDEKSTEPA